MFCSNCGKEATGNFCWNCGAQLISNSGSNDTVEPISSLPIDEFIIVNGIQVNITDIINTYGKDKISAIKYLNNLTGIGLSKGKSIIDDAYSKFYKPEPKKGFWQSVKEEARAQNLREMEKKQEDKARVEKMDSEGVAYCPKCHSTSLSAHKKGFGIGKALLGAAIDPIGLVAGNIGAKKVRVTCLKCGHQFWAGKK